MLKMKYIVLKSVVFKGKNVIKKFLMSKKGFGLNEVLGIAAGIIIAALIVIPGLKNFAKDIIDKLTAWWSTAQTNLLSPP